MADVIDKSQFKVNERAREYSVIFEVKGEIRRTIMADSLAEAREKADAMLATPHFGQEIDDVEDVTVDHVYKHPPMYLVLRDGRNYQVSSIRDGDLPREPDERGF